MILELKFEYLNRLQEIAPKDFPFPDISSGLYCSQKALFNGDKLIGAALLKLTSEAILILDSAESEISRARAISEAFEQVPNEMAKFGLDQTHVFILPEHDERYAHFLIKNFNFKRATGIPLVFTK